MITASNFFHWRAELESILYTKFGLSVGEVPHGLVEHYFNFNYTPFEAARALDKEF